MLKQSVIFSSVREGFCGGGRGVVKEHEENINWLSATSATIKNCSA